LKKKKEIKAHSIAKTERVGPLNSVRCAEQAVGTETVRVHGKINFVEGKMNVPNSWTKPSLEGHN